MISAESAPAEVVVAVDLGGTLTKIAYVARDGSALDVRRVQTRVDDHGAVPPEWLADLIIEAVRSRPELRIVGYGFVAPGVAHVEVEGGVVERKFSLTLPEHLVVTPWKSLVAHVGTPT